MKLRLFIAIELPDSIKRSLASLQGKMEKALPPLRWVKPEAIHLTLKFLGHVKEDTLPGIKEIVTAVAEGSRPFTVVFSGIGAFPNMRRPRVVWVGVREESGELRGIAERMDRMAARLGITIEKRPYKPHLTIGRVRGRGGGNFGEALPLFKDEEIGKMRVDEISLIRSELTPKGAIYTALHRARLS